MSRAFFHVISQIVFGGMALTPLVPFDVFGSAFFRANAIVYLLLLWLASSFLPWPEGRGTAAWVEFVCTHAAFVLLAVYNIALWVRRDSPSNGLAAAVGIAGAGAILAAGFSNPFPLQPAWQHAALSISYLFSAWVSGAALLGMLIGHWYLMKSSLPFEPLVRISRVFGIGAVASGAFWIVLQLGQAATAKASAIGLAFSPVYVLDLMVWIRLAVGIAAPIGLSYMILESAKLKANMSATGLFYVAFGAAAAGDLVARALLAHRGLVL